MELPVFIDVRYHPTLEDQMQIIPVVHGVAESDPFLSKPPSVEKVTVEYRLLYKSLATCKVSVQAIDISIHL